MIGVYQIKNLVNNKVYIGCSKRIEVRWKEHKRSAFDPDIRNYKSKLYKAIRKYGLENFSFEVIELTNEEDRFEREIYYIDFYNSYKEGYNESLGGEGIASNYLKNEDHPMANLTNKEVEDIRMRYNNKERHMDVYEIYKNQISHGGFNKIWSGTNWKTVMPEVYTEENRLYHKNNKGMKGIKNGRSKLTENDVYNIRVRRKNGEKISQVHSDYQYTGITLAGFKNIWYYTNWKDIIVE